jgi:hypothetical protein
MSEPLKISIRFFNDREVRSVWDDSDAKCPEFTAEAIRVINSTQHWIPGMHDGQYVRSYLEIPIRMSVK